MLDAKTIEGFVSSCLLKKFDNAVAIPSVHKEWWNLCCSDFNFIAIAAPRSHAKSTALTFSFVLAKLLFRESKFCLIVSDTEAQSTLFLGDIKNELLENEDLIHLFGIKKFTKLAETDIIVEMNDGHRFRVMAKGSEQKLRGVKWNNQRPDLIMCDDMENDEIVENQDRRIKFRRWFYGALLPARNLERCKVIVVGTILHMDSLLERLMPKVTDPTVYATGLRVMSMNDKLWKSVKYKAHTPDFKHILWKDKFTEKTLRRIRADYVEQGMPDIYSQEYLNEPIDESIAYFKRDELREFGEKDYEGESQLVYYVGYDLAVSKESKADWTVFVIVGIDDKGRMLIKDVRRGRWDSLEIVDEMFDIQTTYWPEFFVSEKGIIDKSIGPVVNQQMLERNIYLNLIKKTANKDKYARARSIQNRIRAGNVYFNKKAEWYLTLEDEMAKFPRDRHDDQVDALAWVGLEIDNLQSAPTPQDLDEEDYTMLLMENDEQWQGRCMTTGY